MSKRAISALTIAAAISIPTTMISLTTSAQAQSFSCSNAQLPSEMAICNSESLLVKDEQVASLLASKLVTATASGKMQDVSQEHGDWMKLRNACFNDFECLEDVYDKRILSLTGRDL
ncbi:MAG: hypothetical protein QNJ29_05125 [Rhizobiaceae bacterium]|nr:hypothetical protein [Rhizobiaceae bacterium]